MKILTTLAALVFATSASAELTLPCDHYVDGARMAIELKKAGVPQYRVEQASMVEELTTIEDKSLVLSAIMMVYQFDMGGSMKSHVTKAIRSQCEKQKKQ
ncbi:MAG: hypothetical protein FJX25_04015 [Alphaproteobacteria bacterium]|nr:hypothetical protein [Alphaproteobacteria bacterium]